MFESLDEQQKTNALFNMRSFIVNYLSKLAGEYPKPEEQDRYDLKKYPKTLHLMQDIMRLEEFSDSSEEPDSEYLVDCLTPEELEAWRKRINQIDDAD